MPPNWGGGRWWKIYHVLTLIGLLIFCRLFLLLLRSHLIQFLHQLGLVHRIACDSACADGLFDVFLISHAFGQLIGDLINPLEFWSFEDITQSSRSRLIGSQDLSGRRSDQHQTFETSPELQSRIPLHRLWRSLCQATPTPA